MHNLIWDLQRMVRKRENIQWNIVWTFFYFSFYSNFKNRPNISGIQVVFDQQYSTIVKSFLFEYMLKM